MTDGKGGCCIARWGGGHVAEYNSSAKMDMIMLKFRPIAPKPVDGTTAATTAADGGSGSSRHAKAGGRGRRKSNNNNNNNNSSSNSNNSNSGNSSRRCNNNNNNSNGRKRKSSSPDHHLKPNHEAMMSDDDQKADLTLLPLFPEAPDLSPTSINNNCRNFGYDGYNNQVFNNNDSPMFSLNVEGNYGDCHHSWR